MRQLWEDQTGVLSVLVLHEFYAALVSGPASPVPRRAARELVDAYSVWPIVSFDAAGPAGRVGDRRAPSAVDPRCDDPERRAQRPRRRCCSRRASRRRATSRGSKSGIRSLRAGGAGGAGKASGTNPCPPTCRTCPTCPTCPYLPYLPFLPYFWSSTLLEEKQKRPCRPLSRYGTPCSIQSGFGAPFRK